MTYLFWLGFFIGLPVGVIVALSVSRLSGFWRVIQGSRFDNIKVAAGEGKTTEIKVIRARRTK